MAEACDIRRPQSLLALAMKDLHLWITTRDVVGQRAGPIRGSVVDHQDVRLCEMLVNGGHERRKILPLVVGGNDHEHGGHRVQDYSKLLCGVNMLSSLE